MNPSRCLILLFTLLCAACSESQPTNPSADNLSLAGERWYSDEQVAAGALVFQQNCAVCHGASAQGTVEDWRERLPDGSFPPPPLDGSAHAWHHPRSLLIQVINEGGAEFGGKMPGFDSALAQDEKLAAIAYFQDFWSDEIYANWLQMGGVN
ncbi:MAG: cytochrome c [Pseudomonadales bacterium]|nr:cytochrome c [Pseudomonadales bacterium]